MNLEVNKKMKIPFEELKENFEKFTEETVKGMIKGINEVVEAAEKMKDLFNFNKK
jgi:hypothetical protein